MQTSPTLTELLVPLVFELVNSRVLRRTPPGTLLWIPDVLSGFVVGTVTC